MYLGVWVFSAKAANFVAEAVLVSLGLKEISRCGLAAKLQVQAALHADFRVSQR